jgi:hypothetical protein
MDEDGFGKRTPTQPRVLTLKQLHLLPLRLPDTQQAHIELLLYVLSTKNTHGSNQRTSTFSVIRTTAPASRDCSNKSLQTGGLKPPAMHPLSAGARTPKCPRAGSLHPRASQLLVAVALGLQGTDSSSTCPQSAPASHLFS